MENSDDKFSAKICYEKILEFRLHFLTAVSNFMENGGITFGSLKFIPRCISLPGS